MADEQQPQTRKIEFKTPEGMPRVYANNVSMASTRFDLRIVFGEVMELSEDKIIVENRAQVTVT